MSEQQEPKQPTQGAKSTITIQGQEYEQSSLPKEVIQLIGVFQQWTAELSTAKQEAQKAQLEVSKIDAAIREISREVIEKTADIQPVSTGAGAEINLADAKSES